jgi:rare lipoprotein A (peptidoglycan hydrolase)
MKTKLSLQPKRRTKAVKIALLKRSAAAKSHHHRKRVRKLAHQHLMAFGLLFGLTMAGTGSVVFAMADNLIPPPTSNPDVGVYERAAAARRAVEAQQAVTIPPPDQTGSASWYALGLASPDSLTCASTRFPRGTYLQVTDLRNGHQMVCLVNDYGPASWTGRVIDLSRGSYSQLEGLGSGTMPVEIRVVTHP